VKVLNTENGPQLEGLPEGNVLIFFAKVNPAIGYCALFDMEEKYQNFDEGENVDLAGATLAIISRKQSFEQVPVLNGFLNFDGSGFAELKRRQVLRFCIPGKQYCSSFEGHPFERVYHVLVLQDMV
jgi:hypothetical protein